MFAELRKLEGKAAELTKLGDTVETLSASLPNRSRQSSRPGPCPACGAGGIGDAFFDNYLGEDPNRPGYDIEGRCIRCGTC